MIKIRVCQYVLCFAITTIIKLIQKKFSIYCLDYVTQQNAIFEDKHIKPSCKILQAKSFAADFPRSVSV